MQNTWVDFRAIKSAVTITMVLSRYGIKLKKSGKELRGKCPIHLGEGTDTFHANVEKNAFHCFSCKARGNVLDFAAAMEKCSLREAAVKLQDWFGVAVSSGGERSPKPDKESTGSELATEESRGAGTVINPPLIFQLKGVDARHPYLASRGIRTETAEDFGVGFYSGRGSMSGRIVIPIRNETGELVAYVGRAIDDSEPKYKFPVGFKKSHVLFNLDYALELATADTIILVEGFFDCLKLTQAEQVCVALMGSSLSPQQEQLLAKHFRRVVIMLDGDEAGRNGTDDILLRLGRKVWVKSITLPDGKQPDQMSAEELTSLLPDNRL